MREIIQSAAAKGKELLSFVAVLHAVVSISVPFSLLNVLSLLSEVLFSSLWRLKQYIPLAFMYLPCCWWWFVSFVIV